MPPHLHGAHAAPPPADAPPRAAPHPNTPVQVIQGWAGHATSDPLAIPPPPRVPVCSAHDRELPLAPSDRLLLAIAALFCVAVFGSIYSLGRYHASAPAELACVQPEGKA
jgi:hypothetical protein